MSATVLRDEDDTDATLNVVIIYDTFDLAVKARVMLERHRTNEPTNWNIKPWRVDVLKQPAGAEEALTEAAEAHLILLAVRHVLPFLPWLVDWLERWAIGRQVQEAALAVWDDGITAAHSARAIPELSQFAGRHGLSLIFDSEDSVTKQTNTYL